MTIAMIFKCNAYGFATAKKDLHEVAILWNLHNIRPSRNTELSSGRSDTMCFVSEITGTHYYKIDVDMDVAKEAFSSNRLVHGCFSVMLMQDNRLNHRSDAEEATALYLNLLHLIDSLF